MLGCKCYTAVKLYAVLLELIDTCWDVNKDVQGRRLDLLLELIDTCWDVNFMRNLILILSFMRINRYMLGCKCR